MEKSELEGLKKEIEDVRELINTYIEYPEIFKDELVESSQKIDTLINEYLSQGSNPHNCGFFCFYFMILNKNYEYTKI